jgi:lysophospholipase L1-like esterase
MKSSLMFCLILLCVLPISAQTPATQANQPDAAASQQKEISRMQAKLNDWAELDRYRAANATLPQPAPGEQRVVFFGDSITDGWPIAESFPGKPYVNRGISGQTTPQMLIRFQQDVVHLKPAAVIILAGTNDIASNTGPSTPEMIEDNFTSIAAIAKKSGIRLIIASILPAAAYPWKPGIQPADEIRTINAWLKDFAQRDGDIYLDYYTALADAEGGMKSGLSKDGVHPTPQGYAVMAPLADKAIAAALESGK